MSGLVGHVAKMSCTAQVMIEQSPPPPPPNNAALGTGKNRRYWKTEEKGGTYNQEKHILDLKISGGIGGEAVNGWAVLRDCICAPVGVWVLELKFRGRWPLGSATPY